MSGTEDDRSGDQAATLITLFQPNRESPSTARSGPCSEANKAAGQETPPEEVTRGEDASCAAFLELVEAAWGGTEAAGSGVSSRAESCPLTDSISQAGSLSEEAIQPAAGKQFGRFRLLRELGRGGYGVVLLAEDPLIGRLVALKVPRPEVLLSAESHHRFLREARAAAGLNHPHIVAVYEAGQIGPVSYIASAYCPGVSLARWLAEERQPVRVDVAATIVALLADAVQHAHSRGVLHRDIKPSNVLCEERKQTDASGEAHALPYVPKLTDFGLAKLLEEDGARTTHSGALLGTPAYMAPEQAAGETSRVSAATDVYALGCVLFELLTAHPPFVGPDAATVRRVIEEPVTAPRRLRADVPRDLEAICLKCLEKNPRHRYSSAAALGEDLRRFMAGLPVAARPVPAAVKLWRWSKRRPALAALSACLIAAVLGGVSGIAWQWRRAEASLAAKEAHKRRAEEHWLEESRLVSELFRQSDVSPSKSRPLVRAQSRERLEERYLAIVAEGPDGRYSAQEFATACTKGALLLSQEPLRLGEATDLAERGLSMWRRLAAKNPGNLTVALGLGNAELDAAYVYLSQGKFEPAAALAQEAATLFPALADPKHEVERFRLGAVFGMIAEERAKVARGRAQIQRAAAAYRRAADYWRALGKAFFDQDVYRLQLRVCLKGLADCQMRVADWRGNLASQLECIEIDRELVRKQPNDPVRTQNLAQSYITIANLHESLGDHSAAAAANREAEQLLLSFLDDDSSDLSASYRSRSALLLGQIYDSLEEIPQAVEQFAKAADGYGDLALQEPEVLARRVKLAEALFWKARLEAELNRPDVERDFERACQLAAQAAEEGEHSFDLDHFSMRFHMVYARHLVSQGQKDKALPYFATAADLLRELITASPGSRVFAESLAECERMLAGRSPESSPQP